MLRLLVSTVLVAGSTALIVAQGRAGGPPATQGLPAQAGVASQPVELKPGVGTILGRVVEGGTNTGVAGAVVMIGGSALGDPSAMFSNGVSGGPRRATTDALGQFLFRELPAGSYRLSATAVGYGDGLYGDTRLIQIRRSLDLQRMVEISESDTKPISAPIQVWRNGSIGGRVLDEAGEPMVGVQVSVLARLSDWSGSVMQPAQVTRFDALITDDRGIYHADVKPGDYIVGVLAATTTYPVALLESFQQAQREGGAAFEAYMQQIVSGTGILPRGYGSRIGGFHVAQLGMLNQPVVPPMTGEPGSAFFYPSAFHPASLTTMGASVITVQSGEEKTGIDIVMRPLPARQVSGRVLGPAGPIGNVALMLVSPDPAVNRTSPATLIDTPQAIAGADGAFTFLGIAPGTYILRAQRRPTNATEPNLWAHMTVSIGESSVTDLQVRLQTAARVSGRVVAEGDGPPPDPKQLASIAVGLRPLPGSPAAFTSQFAPDRADTSGRFTTRESIPGPYVATVSGTPAGWVVKSVTIAGQNAIDKAFDLPLAGISDMVVTITNQVSQVVGTARDGSGAPVPSATVVVFPVDRSLWLVPGMASRRVQTAAPGRDGRFSFRALPAGEYYLAAADWPSADFSDGNVLTKVIPSATRILVSDGGTVAQDLRVAVIR